MFPLKLSLRKLWISANNYLPYRKTNWLAFYNNIRMVSIENMLIWITYTQTYALITCIFKMIVNVFVNLNVIWTLPLGTWSKRRYKKCSMLTLFTPFPIVSGSLLSWLFQNQNGKWQICVDYKELNKDTKKDHFPLHFINQVLDTLEGNDFLSFLDGFRGYN